jgi:hypothetical protein
MKNSIASLLLALFAMTATSCQAIAGIFKAGMGFGILLVVVVIIIIVAIALRASKK